MTILNRLLITYLPLSLGGIILISVFTFSAIQRTIIQEARRFLETLADSQESIIEEFLKKNHIRLALVASRTQMRLSLQEYNQTQNPEAQQLINPILRDIQSADSTFEKVSILNPQGEIVASTEPQSIGENHAHQNYFLQGKTTSHTDLLFLENGLLKSHFAAPLILGTQLIGVIWVQVKIQEFSGILKNDGNFWQTGEILLARKDEQGNAQFIFPLRFEPHHLPLTRIVPRKATFTPIMQALDQKEITILDALDYQGTPVIAVTRYFKKPGWGLVVKVHNEEIFHSSYQFLLLLTFFTILLLLFIVGLSFYFSRQIAQPITTLAATAANVIAGDTSLILPVSPIEELTSLAASFEKMTHYLIEKNQVLHQTNQDLQQQIQARGVAEAELEKYQEHLEKLVEVRTAELDKYRELAVQAAPNAMILTAPDGNMILVNQETTNIFGYSQNELLGHPVEMLIPQRYKNDHPGLRESFIRAPEKREMGAGRDLYGLAKNGKEIPIEIGLNPIATSQGTYVLSAIVDIRQRKRDEEELKRKSEELEHSNQELELFAYIASHDLQTPLRSLISYADFLREDYQGQLAGKGEKYLENIIESGQMMKQLIEDLLVFSRVGTAGQPFSLINCEELLSSVLNTLGSIIQENEAVVSHDTLPEVIGDATQLRQLLQNLIENAIKYRKAEVSPRIHILADSLEDTWRFAVQDNGEGIKAGFHERIFIIFQRLHSIDEKTGTGIGLALCKKIVERHGGHIWVESQPQQGSTFYFTLSKREEL